MPFAPNSPWLVDQLAGGVGASTVGVMLAAAVARSEPVRVACVGDEFDDVVSMTGRLSDVFDDGEFGGGELLVERVDEHPIRFFEWPADDAPDVRCADIWLSDGLRYPSFDGLRLTVLDNSYRVLARAVRRQRATDQRAQRWALVVNHDRALRVNDVHKVLGTGYRSLLAVDWDPGLARAADAGLVLHRSSPKAAAEFQLFCSQLRVEALRGTDLEV